MITSQNFAYWITSTDRDTFFAYELMDERNTDNFVGTAYALTAEGEKEITLQIADIGGVPSLPAGQGWPHKIETDFRLVPPLLLSSQSGYKIVACTKIRFFASRHFPDSLARRPFQIPVRAMNDSWIGLLRAEYRRFRRFYPGHLLAFAKGQAEISGSIRAPGSMGLGRLKQESKRTTEPQSRRTFSIPDNWFAK
ncbi:MAG: hypothetical protein JNM27_09605 [Leptospirales bacterium]|nr:hypothetical protein [Leptospirales bacterium]